MKNSILDYLDYDTLKSDDVIEKEKNIEKIASEYSLVYLVFESGKNGGNLWILKNEDAKKLCSDKCSKGKIYNHEYIYMWTSLLHFTNDKKEYDGVPEFIMKVDNGSRDKDFERLGIKKPSLKECEQVLEKIGYQIKKYMHKHAHCSSSKKLWKRKVQLCKKLLTFFFKSIIKINCG